MASSSGERKRSPQPKSQSPTSTTPTLDPPGPTASGFPLGCVGQKRLEEGIAAAGDQRQHVPAPLVSMDEDEEMGIPDHDSQALAISDPSPDCAGQEQGREGLIGACDRLQHLFPSWGVTDKNEEMYIDIMQHSGQAAFSKSSPGCAAQEYSEIPQLQHTPLGFTERNEEVIITAIRATNVALGLRRLPAGFHVMLHHNGLEWRAENRPSSVNNVVEWSGPIPISSDLSAIIRLEVYASFEYMPTLGAGEQLRKLRTTVGQLLDRSAEDTPFTFFPEDGDVVSPCSSILVTVKRQKRENCDPSGSKVIGARWSTPEPRGELEDATDQGHSALTRYRKHREKQDLEHSIQRFECALNACPWDDPRRVVAKTNLGIAELILYQVEGTAASLEIAFQLHRDALAARPVGHPDRLPTLIQLASVHLAGRNSVDEADRKSAERLLREAIGLSTTESYERQAVILMLQLCAEHRGGLVQPDGQSSTKQDLTLSLTDEDSQSFSVQPVQRFERFGDLADLERAITILEGQIKSVSLWDRKYCVVLGNLGAALLCRFERLGKLDDLRDAISTQREAVGLATNGHTDKCTCLSNLGISFQTRFERLGELGDLEDAISTQREAVRLTSDSNPHRPIYLSNLGTSFRVRFERLGQLSDLEDGISTQREAVRLTPDGRHNKPGYLSNLGNSFRIRFERLGQLDDLEEAILTQKEAVRLTPDGHPDKPALLSNLGHSFRTRFSRLGQLDDLEEAILTQKEAVWLTPDGHPDKPGRLNNLGISFEARFSRLRQLDDLEDAILRKKEAVHLTPDGHPDKPMYLSNLGKSFTTRFEGLKHLDDLEEAISVQRESLYLTPDGHPDMRAYLHNLGTSFRIRFEHLGVPDDLEASISNQREAVGLTLDGHYDKPAYLNNLGNSFQTRFERFRLLSDLEDAISRRKYAVRLTPPDHPDKSVYMNNLARSFVARFLHLRQVTDLEHAISLSSHVASIPIGHPRVRLSAAQLWIQCARSIRHSSLVHAYSVAVSLTPQLAWIGLSFSHRYDQLIQSAGVVREAAAAALEAGLLETAVEWLEQGRSVIWGDLLQLRSPHEELSSAYPDYASRLCTLSTQLDQASAAHEQSLSSLSKQDQIGAHSTAECLRQVADRHRALAIERDKLLREIRRLPGFEKFLLRKPFSQLRAAAHSGPVVILNAAETRCDALIVVAGLDHVIHVPLPTFSLERSVDLQNTLKGFIRDARALVSARIGISWNSILSSLWECVVKPVLDVLAIQFTTIDPSRIFWCPTGPLMFLPIHAAGFYDQQHLEPGNKVFDFVVSSYVPSLSALLKSSNPDAPHLGSPLRLLLVPQPLTDGHFKLPGATVELQHISNVVRSSPLACTMSESSDGTVEEVLELMKQADWVHFACHGVQDGVDSGLCLANQRRLKLRDIVALSRHRGGLAFLSACQTAQGEQGLSDEAIHIAAGMLFAGYGGVIGTMWVINDMVAPDVARKVYEELLGKGTRADYRGAARALHKATRDLRERGMRFNDWIPFIHVGL